MSKVPITVGCPIYDGFKGETVSSLLGALAQIDQFHFTIQKSCYLDVNRELIAQEAVKFDSDYLIFVDSDLAFPHDALAKLLALKKDIVGANYYLRKLPLEATVRLDDGQGGYLKGMVELPKEPFQCMAVATGLMVIDMRRLKECLQPPYFAYGTVGTTFQGEDIRFCDRARRAGMEVWCDPTINVLHIGDFPFGKLDD